MRRTTLTTLALVLCVASSAVAQRVDGGVRLNGALQGTPINNPIFTGQWTVNLVLCAAGTVLQGGSPTTCTANPSVTSVLTSGSLKGGNASFDPSGWGSRLHLSLSDATNQPVQEFVYTGTDGTGVAISTIDHIATSNTLGYNEIAQAYVYTAGGTANNRGAQFRWYTKRDGASSLPEALRVNEVQDVLLMNGATASSARLGWNGGVKWFSNQATSSAQVRLVGNSEATGVCWDVATDNVFKVFGSNTNCSTAGTVQSATVNATTAFQINGAALTSGTTVLSSGSGMGVANVGANSCGTSAASIAGNNNAFVITVGATAGTQCRVAFTVTATTAWVCAANDDTTTVAVRTTPVDTTHLDLIGAFTAGDNVSAVCFPR